MKQTSQRSLLFRQNVNRTEAAWVHFLDGKIELSCESLTRTNLMIDRVVLTEDR